MFRKIAALLAGGVIKFANHPWRDNSRKIQQPKGAYAGGVEGRGRGAGRYGRPGFNAGLMVVAMRPYHRSIKECNHNHKTRAAARNCARNTIQQEHKKLQRRALARPRYHDIEIYLTD